MKTIKYIIRIFHNINFDKMFETTKKISKRKKQLTIFVVFDMIWCALRYGAGYNDYLYFGLYALKSKYRKTYITRGYNNKLVNALNKKEDMHILDNKNEFNELFKDYLKRDWIYLDNGDKKTFIKWLENKDEIIAKPNNGSGGVGIEKIIVSDFSNPEQLYQYLKDKKLQIIEEVLKQVDYLNEIHDKSVNTVRIITITNNDKTLILNAFLRVGNGGFVDNTCSGGMVVPIDITKGETIYPGTDLEENVYDIHPLTNRDIVGIKIKDWDACVELVKKASKLCPTIRYVGWDVAITPFGPCLIEGNPYPGYYYQFPIYLPDKIGFMPKVKDILNELNLDI